MREISKGDVIKKAVKEGLSYTDAKVKYGVKIRKQSYLALKKVAREEQPTKGQLKEIKRMVDKKEEYKDIIKEFKLDKLLKTKYIGAGDVIISSNYASSDKVSDFYTEVLATVEIEGEDEEDVYDTIEINLYNSIRMSYFKLFDNKIIAGIIPIRIDFHENFRVEEKTVLDYRDKGDKKEDKIKNITLYENYTTFVIEKKYNKRKSYDYSNEIFEHIEEELGKRNWNIVTIEGGGKDGGN